MLGRKLLADGEPPTAVEAPVTVTVGPADRLPDRSVTVTTVGVVAGEVNGDTAAGVGALVTVMTGVAADSPAGIPVTVTTDGAVPAAEPPALDEPVPVKIEGPADPIPDVPVTVTNDCPGSGVEPAAD